MDSQVEVVPLHNGRYGIRLRGSSRVVADCISEGWALMFKEFCDAVARSDQSLAVEEQVKNISKVA